MILYLDFESHYSKEYSLSRMPTQAYLRDARFECLGCAIAIDNGPAKYVTGDTVRQLLSRMPWQDITAVAHNAAFDMALLADIYGHVPGRIGCTQALARWAIASGHAPDQRVGLRQLAPLVGMAKGEMDQTDAVALAAYATTDVEICRALWVKYAHLMPQSEMDIMDMHAQLLVRRPLRLDKTLLAELSQAEPDDRAVLLRKPEIFATALRACGVEPGTKTSPATGKAAHAFAKTDPFMQGIENHEDPRVQILHRLRTEGTSNIVRTRAARLLSCVPTDDDSFGAPLDYYGTISGRTAGRGMLNMQNFPARHPQQLALRRCITAPQGHKLVVVDSAQIEVRVLAWLAGNTSVLDTFRAGRDVYREFGAVLYDRPAADITKPERQIAKACILGLGFGMGADKFGLTCQRQGVEIDPSFVVHAVSTYRRVNSAVVRYWRTALVQALTGRITLPSGRTTPFPSPTNSDGGVVYSVPTVFSGVGKTQRDKLYGGVACNRAVQGTARDIVMAQTLAACRAMPSATLAMMCHDEAVWVVPEPDAQATLDAALLAFCTPPAWAADLPLGAEGGIYDNYGDAK